MIRILYAMNGVFASGGTEAVILSYYNNIDRSIFTIDFLLHGHEEKCRDNMTHHYLLNCGSRIYYVTPRGENPLKNASEIRKILTENKYDIVHSHMDTAGAFLLEIAKKCGVKITVSHSHNTADQLPANKVKKVVYSNIYKIARNKINHYSDVRLACSTEAGKWLYGEADFTVINNAADLIKFSYNKEVRNEIRSQMGLDDNFVIGHVGRFAKQKNHSFLINVFSLILKTYPDVRLMLIGDGDPEDVISNTLYTVREQVNKLGIADKVLFLGKRDDVELLMQVMDVFALPSLFEGMPVVLVEAQAANLPCVVSDRITRDVDVDGKFVYLPINDSGVWANSIAEFAVEAPDRSIPVSERLKKEFSCDEVVAKLSGIYEKAYRESQYK